MPLGGLQVIYRYTHAILVHAAQGALGLGIAGIRRFTEELGGLDQIARHFLAQEKFVAQGKLIGRVVGIGGIDDFLGCARLTTTETKSGHNELAVNNNKCGGILGVLDNLLVFAHSQMGSSEFAGQLRQAF